MTDARQKSRISRIVCWIRGHEWVEVQLGEERLGLNRYTECARCGKTVKGVHKYGLGGQDYPEIDNDE